MPEAVVFILRAVVLVLLWGFVLAAVVAVRHDVFGTRRPQSAPASPAAAARPLPAKQASSRRQPAVARALVVVAGDQRGTRVALSGAPITLGRAADCTLVLTDDYSSNHHARLTPRGDGWILEDTGSTNGTVLGDVKVTAPVEVGLGVPIKIGRTTLELQP